MTFRDERIVNSLDDQRLHRSDRLVLGYIARRARSDGRAWPSALTIAEDERLSYRQVRSCLGKLVDLGYITKVGTTGQRGRVRVWLLADGLRASVDTFPAPTTEDVKQAMDPAGSIPKPAMAAPKPATAAGFYRERNKETNNYYPPTPHEERPAAMTQAKAHGGQMDQLPFDGPVPAPRVKAPPTVQDFANWAYAQGFEDIRPMVARFLLTAAPPSEADEFEEWWKLYPRKQGKGQARTAYAKARQTTSAHTLMASLRDQLAEYQRRGPKYTPMPTTWLNGEQWTNVFTPEPTYSDPYANMENITAIRLGWTNGQRH